MSDYEKGVADENARIIKLLQLRLAEYQNLNIQIGVATLADAIKFIATVKKPKFERELTPLQKLALLERPWERRAFIETLRSERGGFTRKTVESLGVSWPPVGGWRWKLEHDDIDPENRIW